MTQIPWLEDGQAFPSTHEALSEPSGLLAAGDQLTVERLLEAYPLGIFPWYEEGQPILWWSPNPRATLLPGKIHLSRSMKKVLRQHPYTVSTDRAFSEVIEACAEARNYTSETWITQEICETYTDLHRRGIAHSVEVWDGQRLVGGLYGIALGKVFFGESMFSRESNTSKIALAHLSSQLHSWGFELIDCQVENDHLNSLGAQCIDRYDFNNQLQRLIAPNDTRSQWGQRSNANEQL